MECGGHGFLQIYCVCLFRITNRRRESETQNGVFLIYTAFGIGFRVFPSFEHSAESVRNPQTILGLLCSACLRF